MVLVLTSASRCFGWQVQAMPCSSTCAGSLSLCDSPSRTGDPLMWPEISLGRNGSSRPGLQFPIFPGILHHRHASALGMRLQALQGFNERPLPLPPRAPDVGDATPHLDISVARHDFPLYLTPSEALQAVTKLLGCNTIMFVEARDRRFAAQGLVPPDIIAVVPVRGQILAEGFQHPRIVLPITVFHVVSQRVFQFAVGLRVIDRGVDEADPHVLTTRHQEPSLEWWPVVEEHGLGNHPPLPHGSDDGAYGRAHVWGQE